MRSPTLYLPSLLTVFVGVTVAPAIASDLPAPAPSVCGCCPCPGTPRSTERADVPFPLPDSVFCLQFWEAPGRGSVNFQTEWSQAEAIAFYREALTASGLTERTLNTVITEDVFSLVFDGWSRGEALIIQGVDLGDRINLNLRLEML